MSLSVCQRLQGIRGNKMCPCCGTTWENNEELLKHLWKQNRKEPSPFDESFLCPWTLCVARLRDIPALKDHIKTHTGERDHVCPHLIDWTPGNRTLCLRTYPSAKSLSRHRQRAHRYLSTTQRAEHPYVDKNSGRPLEDVPLLGLGDSEDNHPIIKIEDDSQSDGSNSEPTSAVNEDTIKEHWSEVVRRLRPRGNWPSHEIQQAHPSGASPDDTQVDAIQGSYLSQPDVHAIKTEGGYDHPMSSPSYPIINGPSEYAPPSHPSQPSNDWYGYLTNGYLPSSRNVYDWFSSTLYDRSYYQNANTHGTYSYPQTLPYHHDTSMMGPGNSYGASGVGLGSGGFYESSSTGMHPDGSQSSDSDLSNSHDHWYLDSQVYGYSDTRNA
ncbi:hypothetical protein QCA50_000002 [Cerrena zonata]|uniref:C2H2-type domain-containing protein n=1 Tax=Cerrena zonata TaxID=2478898 RepID=A0AAW0GP41_9APHY